MCGKSEIIQLFFVIFTLIIAFSYAEPPSATKVYRRDYQYSRKAKAFYKLHINEEMKGRNADTICKAEGASLLESTTDKDIEQIHGMMKKYPDIPYVWVGRDGTKYEPAEYPYGDSPLYAQLGGGPECTVLKRNGEKAAYSCYANVPFICKVQEKMAPYSEECGTYGPGYIYRASLGSCYNIPRISYPWNQAYVECEAQGAHLVVLNSEVEYHVVWNLIKASPRLQDSQAWFFYHAGFRAYKEAPHPREFKTIFNQTLEEAGFNLWSKNEPNNAQGSEYCGSIFRHDGMFNDIDCRDPFAFVCEKEIKP